MKSISIKLGGILAALAMAVTAIVANSSCICIAHQEPLPEKAKSLRKF